MLRSSSILNATAVGLALACSALAQNAISAKAGMVNVADGDVYLLDAKGGAPRKVEPKVTEFIEIKEGQTLKTGEGRAEVLLVPGTFLRMAEESSFRLTSNKLTDARIEMLTGSGLLEVSDSMEDSKVVIVTKDATLSVSKAGLYRVDAEPARIRVYLGEALISYGSGQSAVLKGGKELLLGANGWVTARFDAKDTDSLYRWAKRRSGYVAMANVSAARQATPQTNSLRSGAWQWNPYFGFATFIPYGRTLQGPFGYYYYSPYTVMQVYYPQAYSGGGGGGGGYSGNSGFAASMPQRSAGSSSYSPSAGISSANAGSSMGAGSTGSRGGGGSVSSGSVSSGSASSGSASSGSVSSGSAPAGGGGGRGN